MSKHRIDLLGVPLDIVEIQDLESEIMTLVEKPGMKQIVFLSVWGLLKARMNADFRECINNADIVIPVSKSILNGAKFLGKEIPVRYNPFTCVISIMSCLDSHFKSIYLLGSSRQTLQVAERNVHDTFPNLRVVGRYNGFYKKNMEEDVVKSIYKSSPALVLYSEGIKDKECWCYKRRNNFSSSIFLYYKDALGIFSKRIKRINEKTFDKGHEIYHAIVRNPFKLFLIFPFIIYLVTLLWYKLFEND